MFLLILRLLYTLPFSIFVCIVILYNFFKNRKEINDYGNIDINGLVVYYFKKYDYVEFHVSNAFWILLFTILYL